MHREMTAAAPLVTGGWQMITPFDYDRDPERFRLAARVTQQHLLMAHSLYDQLALGAGRHRPTADPGHRLR
jgi:hypothetical protein